MRIEIAVPEVVKIFDYAAHLYVGQRESLCQHPETLVLEQGFFVNLPIKIDDSAVGPDGPRFQPADLLVVFGKWNLNIRVFTALFGQDFDADVVVLSVGPAAIVLVHFAIKDDGRGAGRKGLTGHLQLFWGDGQEALAGAGGQREGEENHEVATDRHRNPAVCKLGKPLHSMAKVNRRR